MRRRARRLKGGDRERRGSRCRRLSAQCRTCARTTDARGARSGRDCGARARDRARSPTPRTPRGDSAWGSGSRRSGSPFARRRSGASRKRMRGSARNARDARGRRDRSTIDTLRDRGERAVEARGEASFPWVPRRRDDREGRCPGHPTQGNRRAAHAPVNAWKSAAFPGPRRGRRAHRRPSTERESRSGSAERHPFVIVPTSRDHPARAAW